MNVHCKAEIVIRIFPFANRTSLLKVSEKQGFVNILAASNSSGRSGGGGLIII